MPRCPECGAEYREGDTRCSACDADLVGTPPEARPPAGVGPEWVAVAGFDTDEEAHLARGRLGDAGISAEVVDKHVVLYPFPQVDEAEVLVLVPPEEVERAKAVLDEVAAGADELPEEDIEVEPGPPGKGMT